MQLFIALSQEVVPLHQNDIVDKLPQAEGQLFPIKHKTKVGNCAKEFHKKNILYKMNKTIANQKKCDTSFYQSPITTFKYDIKTLKYYKEKI